MFWPRRCCGSAGAIPHGRRDAARLPIDFAGTIVLSAGVVALLLGLTDLQSPLGVGLIGLAALLFIVLLWVERRAADPVLPLPLFKDRLFAVAVSQGLLAGWAMFGSTSFIPLFAQAVLGTSATAAGSVLTPMMLGWVGASIIGSRLLLRYGYRTIALVGMATLVVGTFFMTRISPQTTLPILMVNVAVDGHRHGTLDPRVDDRRAEQCAAQGAGHGDGHRAVQPQHRRHAGCQCDGRHPVHESGSESARQRAQKRPASPWTPCSVRWVARRRP